MRDIVIVIVSLINYDSKFYEVKLFLCRNKVDLTKYIEEHNFNFDNCFDSEADN